ncbi:uncharacterized protein [Periplaneta americana]|uniref:uncharacterized protein n=1 Tax=Periplaneta americana TaxID=6978 RepID=UPI0037E94CA4
MAAKCVAVLGLLLLASSPVLGKTRSIFHPGGSLEMNSTMKARSCNLELPNGESCQYTLGVTPPAHDTCSFPDYNDEYCHVSVDIVDVALTGMYTLTATELSGFAKIDIFVVYLKTDGLPKNTLQVIEAENLYLRAANAASPQYCDVMYPEGKTEMLIYNYVKASNNFWGASDECGVKAEGVSKLQEGTWRLVQSNDHVFQYVEFDVQIISLTDIAVEPLAPLLWLADGAGTLGLRRSNMRYCEVRSPGDELVATSADSCDFTRYPVTEADEGGWKLIVGMTGKVTEDEFQQDVTVTREALSVSVTDSTRFTGGLDLLCSLTPSAAVQDCRFTRPDGEVILPDEGIGNAHYTYFGSGLANGDCGLSIQQVQQVDRGWWNCSLLHGAVQSFSLLNVSATDEYQGVWTEEGNLAVLNGAQMTLSCRAGTPLEYCWFRHPSGEHLRFSIPKQPLQRDPFRFYWFADSLHLGVCALSVSQVDLYVDSGQWGCYVNDPDNADEDLEVLINVTVARTNVVSLVEEVLFSPEDTILQCYSVPLGSPLQYCRFIRPDGKGFNVVPGSVAVLERYVYEAGGLDQGECGLRIISYNLTQEDEGEWTCVARLQGSDQEGQDSIMLLADNIQETSTEPVTETETETETVTVTEPVIEAVTEANDVGLSTGTIVAIAIGGAGILLLLGGIAFCIARRMTSTKTPTSDARH